MFLFYQNDREYSQGATRMARGGIRLVHELTKSTLITYFSGMKMDPKYMFLQAFFLICLSCSFQNLSIWPKTHPFFQFCTFLHPKRCMRVHCLVLKNNPNYINFWTSLMPPLDIRVPPPENISSFKMIPYFIVGVLHFSDTHFWSELIFRYFVLW